MEKLQSSIARKGILPDNIKIEIETLQGSSKVFKLEDTGKDTITVFISTEGYYVYTTKECRNGEDLWYNLVSLKNIKELYVYLRSNNSYLDIDEFKKAFKDIEKYCNKN